MRNIPELIRMKRDGETLSEGDIRFLVGGIQEGTVPDYQIAAFAMAVYFRGMEEEELFFLTQAMIESGGTPIPVDVQPLRVDKHSTGGVGDKLSLLIAPLVAACGLKMPKMSGRGLGFSGGTIDKLESIPGFRTDLGKEEFDQEIEAIGCGIIGQQTGIGGVDKKIYAIRDVTATVESIPLIASSIVSKKIASGNRRILFDVKVGRGAFMKTVESGVLLAETMVRLVRRFGGDSTAVVTNMNSPLGHAVGNALEIKEVVECLKGEGPEDLMELSLVLSKELLLLTGQWDEAGASELLQKKLKGLEGLKRFTDMIRFQHGNEGIVEDTDRLPHSPIIFKVFSEKRGYVHSIDAEAIGRSSVLLGAGRMQKDESIDPGAGIYLVRKPGDVVAVGDLLAIGYGRKGEEVSLEVSETVRKAIGILDGPPKIEPLVYKVIRSVDV